MPLRALFYKPARASKLTCAIFEVKNLNEMLNLVYEKLSCFSKR